MKRSISTLVLTASLLAILAGPASAASDAAGSEPIESPAYVETAWVQPASADPGLLELHVSGMLPTPCHRPAWELLAADDHIDVHLWSTQAEGQVCVTVLEPFELVIPLGEDDPALEVTLDGDPVDRGAPSPEGASGIVTGLAGSGWSFGMCLGYCAADLEIDAAAVTLTGRDRGELESVFVNRGELTEQGLALVDTELAALDGQALDAVYGCPDCADGGAAYILLQREDGQSRHEMEFGAPPDELAGLYELTTSISTALTDCRSGELVTVAEDCVAYIRPTD